MPEMILPGVYIEVRPEGLIIPGQITVSNIGIVGTASKGDVSTADEKKPILLGSYAEARQKLGAYDAWQGGGQNELTLVRALELTFNNGATTVFAVRVAGASVATASTQFDSEGGGTNIKLEARSPGEWGNELWFSVADADQPAFVEGETVAVSANMTLNHFPVIKNAKNRIQVGNRTPQIVYGDNTTAPQPATGQVGINTDTGGLVFFAGEEPAAGSPVKASYAVAPVDASIPPKVLARKVTVRLGRVEEVYTVVDGNDLFRDINDPISGSAWVNAVKPDDPPAPAPPTNKFDALPVTGKGFLKGGNNGAAGANYEVGLEALLDQEAHIIIAAGQNDDFGNALDRHCQTASTDAIKHDRIAIVGSKSIPVGQTIEPIIIHNLNSDRVVFVAPGISTKDNAASPPVSVTLPGAYTAAAVAGLLASFAPHISLTNKVLPVDDLERKYNAADLTELVQSRVVAVESHLGFHIVRGITTSTNTAWKQITTRRIVDYAKFGVRSAAQPYIGLLNNERVRGALRTTINSFLAGMVNDEMLISYDLNVTATRQQEIQGIVAVTMVLRPVFSIDFIVVTMFLE